VREEMQQNEHRYGQPNADATKPIRRPSEERV
jgi:hypothetical protein